MRGPIVLCADSFTLRFPEVLGLEEENLSAQGWLRVFSDGEEARAYVADHETTPEVWVLGSDDMEAINVAAAIKQDCCSAGAPAKDCAVYLVADEGMDVPHRAQAASLDGILSPRRFLNKYTQEKAAWGHHCDVYVSLIQDAQEQSRVAVASLPGPVDTSVEAPARSAVMIDAPVESVATEAPVAPVAPVVPVAPPAAREPRALPEVFPEPKEALRTTHAATLRRALLFPVVSATGGVGRSTVCALAGMIAAERGMKTLILDADFQFGNIAAMLSDVSRKSAVTCTFDKLLNRPEELRDLADHAIYGVPTVVGALQNPERAEECPNAFSQILHEALGLFDVVFVNTPTQWSEVQAVLIEQATRVLYVLGQRPDAIRDASGVLALCARCGLPTGAFTLLLNGCKRGAVYGAADISCVLKGFPVVELQDGGMEVMECAAAGRTDGLIEAFNPLARSVGKLMDELLPEDATVRREEAVERKSRAEVLRFFSKRRREQSCPF